MDNLKEEVLSNLRAVTQSSKGGVPLALLDRDYRSVVGTFIPYKDLKYPSLEAFIRDIPEVISISRNKTGELVAEGVADSKTAHIASLVSRQKQAKPSSKKPIRRPYVRRGGFSRYSGTSRGGRSYQSHSSYTSHSSTSSTRTKPSPPSNDRYTRPTYQPPAARSKSPPRSHAPTVPKPTRQPTSTTQNKRNYQLPPRFQKMQQHPEPSRTPSPPMEPIRAPVQEERPYREITRPKLTSVASFESDYGTRSVQSTSSLDDDFDIPLMQPKPLQITVDNNRLARDNLLRELDAAESAMEYVEIYCRANNIQPEYICKKIGQKKKNQTYVCLLILGSNKYQSYPQEASSEREASEIAAEQAVEDLKKNKEKLLILPKTSASTLEEIKLLQNRVEEIVWEKPSGMFEKGIENEYINIYNESLPDGWTDHIRQSGILEVEEVSVSYGSVPSGVQLIIKPAKGASSGSTTPSETSSRANSDLQDLHQNYSNLSSPTSEVPEYGFPVIPPLPLPIGNEWAISITSVVGTMAACFVDYSEEFFEFSKQMTSFYASHHLRVEKVCRRQLLATRDTENKTMIHRVLVTDIISADKVGCYYVDEGYFSEIPISDLQELHKDFYKLSYQAIQIALEDLEEFEDFLKPEHMDFAWTPNKSLIAVVKKCYKPASDLLPNDPAITKMVYSVVLYDTDVPDGEEAICLNDVVKQNILQSLECTFPKMGISKQGYMTHVNDKGEMYLRFIPPVNGWLELKLQQLSTEFESACSEGQFSPTPGSMSVAKFEDELWYRAIIPETNILEPSENELEVFFIDYGHPGLVKKGDICDLEPHSEFLSHLGNQAIKCELHNALPTPDSVWTFAALQKLMEYAAFNEQLIVKVMSEETSTSLTKVVLYKRIETSDDSFIISINENIANKPELFVTKTPSSSISDNIHRPSIENGKGLDLHNNFQKMNIASSSSSDGLKWMMTPDNLKSPEALGFEDISKKPLTLPEIPNVGENWKVFVTIAASPHNFTVQPLDSAYEVDDLRIQMKQFYSLEENAFEVERSIIKVNDFYAALHSDGEWYRVRILSIGNSDTVTCHFVDFGDFMEIGIHQLQILYSQFRILPCQAIKASLAGIVPFGKDWDPLHCVAFKELITEKPFQSFIKNKTRHNENGYPILKTELVLIDTSRDVDLVINDVLVQRGMAK